MSGGDPPAGGSPAGSGAGGPDGLTRAARVMGRRRYRQARRRLREIRGRADDPVAPAFAGAAPTVQLEELFTYSRKRVLTAYLLWLFAGFLGAHRFYLDREGTAAAQFFTGGGLALWWAVDAFLIPAMVRSYNRDQAEREEEGRPPRALDFLETAEEGDEPGGDAPVTAPPGTASGEAGAHGPEGVVPAWADDRAAGPGRLAADLAVVALAGFALGAVSGAEGSWRGAVAVTAIVSVIGFAPELSALRGVPLARDLLRWAARLGLFYRFHDPGGPLSRAARPLLALFYAPFRSRSRAEIHLWAEVGGGFSILFFLVDLTVFGATGLAQGADLFELSEVLQISTRWVVAALLTMVNVYAFAAPVGATLYEHLLAGRSHRRVWLLGGTALVALGTGLAVG